MVREGHIKAVFLASFKKYMGPGKGRFPGMVGTGNGQRDWLHYTNKFADCASKQIYGDNENQVSHCLKSHTHGKGEDEKEQSRVSLELK